MLFTSSNEIIVIICFCFFFTQNLIDQFLPLLILDLGSIEEESVCKENYYNYMGNNVFKRICLMDSHNPNDPIILSASLFAVIFLDQQVNFNPNPCVSVTSDQKSFKTCLSLGDDLVLMLTFQAPGAPHGSSCYSDVRPSISAPTCSVFDIHGVKVL